MAVVTINIPKGVKHTYRANTATFFFLPNAILTIPVVLCSCWYLYFIMFKINDKMFHGVIIMSSVK